MVKAVDVLGSSEDVNSTIYFAQEGDGGLDGKRTLDTGRYTQPLLLEVSPASSLVSMDSMCLCSVTPRMVACQLVYSIDGNNDIIFTSGSDYATTCRFCLWSRENKLVF